MSNDELRKRARDALASQKRPTVTVLSSLLAVHDELGYLPSEAVEEVAGFCDASINDVWGVATFYTNFRFTPPAANAVEVCWGPVCHLVGSQSILKNLMDHLGISDEGDSADERVSLKYNTCLGACSQAPVISINHHLYGRMSPDAARSKVSELEIGKS